MLASRSAAAPPTKTETFILCRGNNKTIIIGEDEDTAKGLRIDVFSRRKRFEGTRKRILGELTIWGNTNGKPYALTHFNNFKTTSD